jgi:hypothetical protein
MPLQQIKGLLVTGDTRNTKVVAVLIAAMTFGALVLLSLERLQPRPPIWSPDTLLMAERGEPVRNVLIEYVPAGASQDLSGFDCVVHPDGRSEWRPRGPDIRLAVVGSASERLQQSQQKSLLAVLGSMSQSRGLDLDHVRLHADSDPRRCPGLSPGARQLSAWLVGKGLVQ